LEATSPGVKAQAESENLPSFRATSPRLGHYNEITCFSSTYLAARVHAGGRVKSLSHYSKQNMILQLNEPS